MSMTCRYFIRKNPFDSCGVIFGCKNWPASAEGGIAGPKGEKLNMETEFTYTTYPQFLAYLRSASEEPFAEFQRRLIPGENILGVRTPKLRAVAKRIAKGDWRRFLDEARGDTLEETVVQGLVTGMADMEYDEALRRAAAFVPKIKSWASCDICGSSFRFLEKNRERSFDFLCGYLGAPDEFAVRFGVILLMDYFSDDGYADRFFAALDGVRHEGYYVKMAVAWAVSVCYVKNPRRTMQYLRNCPLDRWTYNKALQKITESYRVDAAAKETIRSMKRRG